MLVCVSDEWTLNGSLPVPTEQAQGLKDEGNEYFKEKNYKKAIVSYSEGLKRNCADSELNAVLYTNRAAAHYHLGTASPPVTPHVWIMSC